MSLTFFSPTCKLNHGERIGMNIVVLAVEWHSLQETCSMKFLHCKEFHCKITVKYWQQGRQYFTIIYFNSIILFFGLQYMTVRELWVRVILQYIPVCYKICYYCIHINPHQFKAKVCRAFQIPSLPHSSRQPVNIQKSYNKRTA